MITVVRFSDTAGSTCPSSMMVSLRGMLYFNSPPSWVPLRPNAWSTPATSMSTGGCRAGGGVGGPIVVASNAALSPWASRAASPMP
ncbi:Uncharacterised protein [Mycobacterium tuberculosis]|nr:Uncharacterised protein [Mycobacterium tuberculosis]